MFQLLKVDLLLFLHYLDQLTKDVDLTGVEIIEKDQKLIFQARVEVEKQAKVMLLKGLEAQNQSQVNFYTNLSIDFI